MSSSTYNRWAEGQPAYERWWGKQKATKSKAIEEDVNNSDFRLAIYIIPKIPNIMRKQNPPWEIAARLQDKWLSSEGKVYPETQYAETNLIKMEWLLNFEKVKSAYDVLLERITNEASIKLLSETKLPKIILNEFYANLPTTINDSKEFYLSLDEYKVNDKRESVPKFDYYYFNYAEFISKEINELTGALGGGTLRVFPYKMKITKTDETCYSCEILQVGIYLRDSFDFNDDKVFSQPLGYWNPKTNHISASPIKTILKIDYYYVDNASYRQYREITEMGGDFLIFSDIIFKDVSIIFNITIS